MQVHTLSPVDQWFKDHPEARGMNNRNPGIVPPWLQFGDWPGLPTVPVTPDTPVIQPWPPIAGVDQGKNCTLLMECDHDQYTEPDIKAGCPDCHGVEH